MSKLSRRNFITTTLALSTTPLLLSEDKTQKKQSLKFIHITDSHMDLADADSVSAMELMVSHVNENYKTLDLVLFGGDNYNNNVKNAKDAEHFKAICEKLHCPYYVVRGNKESSTKYNTEDTFEKLFLQDKALHVRGKDWVVEKNGYKILGLDSCIKDANSGLFTQETMAFAKEMLENKVPTIIINHHPYTNYWKSTEKKDIEKYVLSNTTEVQAKLFTYPNLILTLSGHKHIDSVKELHGTKTVVTRGFVRPLDLDMYPMRYVEIVEDKVYEKLIYTS